MRLKTSFAWKPNPDGFSPIHLALLNGETKMVLWLLKVNGNLVHVQGWEGMTPLLLKVMLNQVHVFSSNKYASMKRALNVRGSCRAVCIREQLSLQLNAIHSASQYHKQNRDTSLSDEDLEDLLESIPDHD